MKWEWRHLAEDNISRSSHQNAKKKKKKKKEKKRIIAARQGRVLNLVPFVCLFVCFSVGLYFFFSRCCKSALLRTLVSSRAVCRSRAYDVLSTLPFKCECNARIRNGFGLGRSVPPHVDSEEFRNELHSYAQMDWELEAWKSKRSLRRRGEKLNATSPRVSRSKSNSIVYFCILCLRIILCDTSKASENLTFIVSSVCTCCYCNATAVGDRIRFIVTRG